MNIHEMVRAYLKGESLTSLAAQKGCKPAKVRSMLRSRGVHIRDQAEAARMGVYRRLHADDKQCRFLPTPEEIEERAAAIRDSWSEDERASRAVMCKRSRFFVHFYTHNGAERCRYSEVS